MIIFTATYLIIGKQSAFTGSDKLQLAINDARTRHWSLPVHRCVSVALISEPWLLLYMEENCVKETTSLAAVHNVQVSIKCDLIYFDGTETRGASTVGIVVKHGPNSRTVNFRVWIPQLPLDVILSDTRLSAITGWNTASSQIR